MKPELQLIKAVVPYSKTIDQEVQSMKKHARIALSAIKVGLGLGIGLASVTIPTAALAATGTITITQQHNADATYDAYQVFAADISDKDEATHVSWASAAMKETVLAFLDANGYKSWIQANHPGDDQHDRAQNAAEYITREISGSTSDGGTTSAPRTPEGRSFATRLARELAAKSPSPNQLAKAGEAFTGDEGYWLFVTTDTSSEASGEAGTAPIWVPLGGSVTSIIEKSAPPTVDKEVMEDSSSAWGKVADADIGQDVSYRLVATLPANLSAYDTYHLEFNDTLSDGLEIEVPEDKNIDAVLDIDIGGQKVTVDGTNVVASYQENTLTVNFPNLLADHWNDLGIEHDTKVTIRYTAHLISSAKIGAEGNDNGVSLTYTDNPVSRGDGKIEPGPQTKLFAYQIRLLKRDEQTNEPLSGAKFTIQVAEDNSDASSKGLYVQSDGSLNKDPATFVTEDDGTLSVSGIDEGTYIIRETDAPDGYEPINDAVTLVISSSLEGTATKLESLTATATSAKAGLAKVTDMDTAAGTIQLEVTNGKWLLMPITGLSGIAGAGVPATCVALFAGGCLWVRHRHTS